MSTLISKSSCNILLFLLKYMSEIQCPQHGKQVKGCILNVYLFSFPISMLNITDKTETYNHIQSCTCIFLRKLIFQYRALKCKNVKAIRAAHVLHVVYKWVIKKRFSNYTCMANHVHKSQSLL